MSGLGIFDPLLNRQRTDDTKTVHISGGGSNQAPVAGGSSGGGTPGGSDTQIQFNDGGSFGGDSGLVFNKTTNATTFGGDLTVSGSTPTYWIFSNSPRTYSGTDYYGSGVSMIFALRKADSSWADGVLFDDGTASLAVPTWIDGWDTLYIHLVDATALGAGKLTCISSEDWSTTDSQFASNYGPGLITLDYTAPGNITYSAGTWTDSSGLSVAAPSGATTWTDPATITPFIGPKFTVDQDGSTTIIGDLNIGYGSITVTGTGQFDNITTGTGYNSIYGPMVFHSGSYLVLSGSDGFYPPYTTDASEPTAPANGLMIWDDGSGNYYLIYGTGSGNKKVALT